MPEPDYNPDRGAPECQASAGFGRQFARGVFKAAEVTDLEPEPGPRTDQPNGAATHVIGRDVLVNVRKIDRVIGRRMDEAQPGNGIRAERFARDAEWHGEDGAAAERVDAAAGDVAGAIVPLE